MRRGRLVGFLLGGGLLAFGLMGGEYSSWDWWRLRRDLTHERESIQRLQVEIDSLRRWLKALETDSATQERVAREKFGMLRDGEILYRVETPAR
jgi:cell division protein FtsB